MASLHELLLPEARRMKSFFVGSREFDPQHVGFSTARLEGRFSKLETETADGEPIAGNSNRGHSGPGYTGTRGQDGRPREFSADERWDLVEYLKTLR